MNAMRHRGCWGVPPPQMQAGSGFPLQVLAALVPQSAVGFPLQSVTRSTRKPSAPEQTKCSWSNRAIYAKYTWLSLPDVR